MYRFCSGQYTRLYCKKRWKEDKKRSFKRWAFEVNSGWENPNRVDKKKKNYGIVAENKRATQLATSNDPSHVPVNSLAAISCCECAKTTPCTRYSLVSRWAYIFAPISRATRMCSCRLKKKSSSTLWPSTTFWTGWISASFGRRGTLSPVRRIGRTFLRSREEFVVVFIARALYVWRLLKNLKNSRFSPFFINQKNERIRPSFHRHKNKNKNTPRGRTRRKERE